MAKITTDFSAKFQTTKDGDVEDTQFSSGDEVTVVQKWKNHYLIRDDDGHYYNVSHDKVAE